MMVLPKRPGFIRHYTELQSSEPWPSPDPRSAERFSLGASLGAGLGLRRIGVNHEVLPPGRRSSPPHAHSHSEELVFVLAGRPEVWIDGHLHPLQPGDAAAFPAGTGMAHTFINNTDTEVRLLVVGEADRRDDRGFFPLNPELREFGGHWWDDAPRRLLGPHDAMPDRPA